MKIIATGDVHGDWVTGGYERHDEAMGALEHVAQVAVDEKADLFVFLGDLTDPDVDGPLAHRTIARSVAVHRKLEEAGIDDVWIVGNHDVIEDGRGSHTLMALRRAGAFVADRPTTFTDPDGGPFVLLPYPSLTDKYDPAEFIAGFAKLRNSPRYVSGVFGHMTRIEGFDVGSETTAMKRGRDMAFPIAECQRAFGKDVLMVNGHYHDQHLDGPVYTPGSPIRCTHGEEQNQPGYFVLTNTRPWTVEHRKFKNATKLYTHRAGNAVASDFVKDAIVRVVPLPDASQEDRRAWREVLQGAKHVWFAPAAAGAKAVTRAAERVARRGALKGMSPRDVTLAMVEEAATKDRDRLREVVSDSLDKAGV